MRTKIYRRTSYSLQARKMAAEISQVIEEHLKSQEMNQSSDLARRLGVNRSTICRLLKGNKPSLLMLTEIAVAAGVEIVVRRRESTG